MRLLPASLLAALCLAPLAAGAAPRATVELMSAYKLGDATLSLQAVGKKKSSKVQKVKASDALTRPAPKRDPQRPLIVFHKEKKLADNFHAAWGLTKADYPIEIFVEVGDAKGKRPAQSCGKIAAEPEAVRVVVEWIGELAATSVGSPAVCELLVKAK